MPERPTALEPASVPSMSILDLGDSRCGLLSLGICANAVSVHSATQSHPAVSKGYHPHLIGIRTELRHAATPWQRGGSAWVLSDPITPCHPIPAGTMQESSAEHWESGMGPETIFPRHVQEVPWVTGSRTPATDWRLMGKVFRNPDWQRLQPQLRELHGS